MQTESKIPPSDEDGFLVFMRGYLLKFFTFEKFEDVPLEQT